MRSAGASAVAFGCQATTWLTAHFAASLETHPHQPVCPGNQPCPDFSPSIVAAHTKGCSSASVITAPALHYMHGHHLDPEILWLEMRSFPGRTRTPDRVPPPPRTKELPQLQRPVPAQHPCQLVARLPASLLAGMRSLLWLMWAVLPRLRPSLSTQARCIKCQQVQSSYLYPSLVSLPAPMPLKFPRLQLPRNSLRTERFFFGVCPPLKLIG